MGLGVARALGPRRPKLVNRIFPLLLVLAVPLAFSESLDLVFMRFPGAGAASSAGF